MPKGNGKPIPKVNVDLRLSSPKEFIKILKKRFEENMDRHKGLGWSKIEARLESDKKKIASLYAMESTGGEPDVIGIDKKTGQYLYADCSVQSPDRRSICYDREGEKEREKKGIHPGGNAVDLAAEMGVELLSEGEYFELQKSGEFDTKTESWLKTPEEIRNLGGAIFGNRRYGRVFVFHNSAKSFYSSRGFRGLLRV